MTLTHDAVPVSHHFIRGRRGTLLHRQSWLPASSPRGIVHIAHGLGDHAGRHGRLASTLARSGYSVHALDQRGHGYSDGPRATIRHFPDVVADLDTSVTLAQAENPELPAFLLGHSWGALVSLSHAAQHHHQLSGIVAASSAGSSLPIPAAQRAAWAVSSSVDVRTLVSTRPGRSRSLCG